MGAAALECRRRQLRWQIEESPDSEEFVIPAGDVGFILDGGTPSTLEWMYLFDGATASTPDSEYEYIIEPWDGGDITFRGIFDESVENDAAHTSTRRVPRLILFGVPSFVSKGTPVIVRGKQMAVTKMEADANIGIVLRLN
jgi:hypothetical protein